MKKADFSLFLDLYYSSLIKFLPTKCSIASGNLTDDPSTVISVLNIDVRPRNGAISGCLFCLVLNCIAWFEKMCSCCPETALNFTLLVEG